MKHIYALVYEYSYPNNKGVTCSPGSPGGILALYQCAADADEEMELRVKSGQFGDFSKDILERNSGWSSGGYRIFVEEWMVHPSKKITVEVIEDGS